MITPARGWDGHLERALGAVLAQELPPGVQLEIVVALAGDRVPEDVESRAKAVLGSRDELRFVPNPLGSTPDALNAAIDASHGAYVVRVDSRSIVPPHYIATVIDRLRDPSMGCVGGAQVVIDSGIVGSAYAVAFNSPLLGPSPYRYSRRSQAIESPYLGAWRREVLDEVGGFDAELLRNQDNELNDRVRALGLQVFYDASLVVGYAAARSARGLVAHHYEFGWWRMHQQAMGQSGITSRHRFAVGAALATLLAAVGLLGAKRTRRAMMSAGSAAYLGLALSSASCARRMRAEVRRAAPNDVGELHPIGVAVAPAFAAIIDAAWLAGMMAGSRGGEPPGEVRGVSRAARAQRQLDTLR